MPAFLEKESTVDFTLFSSDSALCFGSGREAKHISLSHQNGRREGWRMRRRRRRRRRRRTSIRWQVWSSPFFAGEGFHSAPTSRENQPLLFQRCWQSEPSWNSANKHTHTHTHTRGLWQNTKTGESYCVKSLEGLLRNLPSTMEVGQLILVGAQFPPKSKAGYAVCGGIQPFRY